MNLNEMALAELGMETISDDGVILVASMPKPTPQGENPPAPGPDELFTNPVKNELPELNAEFVVFEDLTDHYADIESIKFRLDQTKTIDKSEAMAIESIVSGFVGRRLPLAGFTEQKTSTQLKQAREQINDKLDQGLQDLANGAKHLCGQVTKQVTDFFKTFDEFVLENHVVNTELFRKILETGNEFSESLNGGVFQYLQREHPLSEALRDQINVLIDSAPGYQNLTFYMQPGKKPTVIFEGKHVVVHEGNCRIMTKEEFREEFDLDVNVASLSLSQVLHFLYGQGLTDTYAQLKEAINAIMGEFSCAEGDINHAMSLRMPQADKAVAVAKITADVRCKYMAVCAIITIIKKYQKLSQLFNELFAMEINEAAAQTAEAAKEPTVSLSIAQMQDKVWTNQVTPTNPPV